MNINLFRKIGIIVGITLGIIYLGFLILPFIISPALNSYIPQINTEIEKATGLKSEIKSIRIVTTPKLTIGAKIKGTEILTPNKDKIIEIDNAQVKLSLIPLLARRIELDFIKIDEIEANIGLNKDGSLEIEKYFPKTEETTDGNDTTAITELPLGLKFSNHLPDIKINEYEILFRDLSNNDKYEIKGNKIYITNFILNKNIKIDADGKIILKDKEQFVYDLKINNKIMPDLDLNELVFNPQPAEEDKKEQNSNVNILEILKETYRNKITANIKIDLTTNKNNENLDFRGTAIVDNLSISPNGLTIPPSDIKLVFKGNTIDINSNLYTAKNEVSKLSGEIKTGKKTKLDLNFKSDVDISNIVKLLNAIATTFNIKDLQTLSASGRLNADFNIKSDLKNIVSKGFLQIHSAKLYYGLYKIGIDNIIANITMDDNNINIGNTGFSILGQPLQIYGSINKDANADLHLTAQNLNLKGLLVALGQAALLKENPIASGTISLKADIVGKLDKINPTAKVNLNNINLKNTPSNTTILLPSTEVNIISDGKTFSGSAILNKLKAINPAATVYAEKININIKEDVIEIIETPLSIEKINLRLVGKVKNYLTEKMTLDFTTKGDINSTLTGDVNMAKQTLNINFSAPNNNGIIIPMFNKSKMYFRGHTSITGSMMNPVLNGNFEIPLISIPEIPIELKNMIVKLNGTILNGKASFEDFASGGIIADNITTDFSMKGENFYLTNIKGNAFDGSINGNIIYNMSNAKTTIDFKGSNMNAEKTIRGAAGIKNALSGTLDFDTKLKMQALDYDKMIKSMTGNLSFKISNGAFGTLGRIENFFNASNITSNAILKNTVSVLSQLAGIKDTAKFEYIQGNMNFSNGWANLNTIKSTGPTLAYYITGKYNILNSTTNVVVLGRLDSSVVALLGPLGDLSASKLLAYIPKIGSATSALVDALTSNPKAENITAIPALTNGSNNYKDFKVVFNGGIESRSSVKSFKWLTTVDKSAIETSDIRDVAKSLKTSLDTDKQNTVKQVIDVVDSLKTQQETLKNSADELKKLFKF